MRDAHSICRRWWFDESDCRKSLYRQRVEGILFEDAVSRFMDDAVPIVIERRGAFLNEPYSEIGFHTISSPSVFLWIINDAGYADKLGFPLR